MPKKAEIREAMHRLSSVALKQCTYDRMGQIFGNGPIHYLVEIGNLFFIAWENNDTGTLIINPITRFNLDELEELGAAEIWKVMCVPTTLNKDIEVREIENKYLEAAYRRSEACGYQY